ncbi:unnamed protein product [Paramecium sonneborni]|uniref:Methyltransferase n=1 Tax=Paramecium sonneborni TaxID=65129 RepID=A0A8S1MYP3_9CILI|nr:unnamed protein product [Paramecium sonneborni]
MYSEQNKRVIKLDEDEENTPDNLITIYEKMNLETAGKIWECSLILGRYLIKQAYFNKIELVNKSVLELGCGTGILSIILGKQGCNVLATDLPQVETLCEQNISKNNINNKVKFKILDWNQSKHKTDCLIDNKHIDILLASDPIYNQKTFESFFAQLKILYELLTNKPILYMAYKCRHDEFDKNLEEQIEQAGLWYKKVDSEQLDDLWKSQQCIVYKIGKF